MRTKKVSRVIFDFMTTLIIFSTIGKTTTYCICQHLAKARSKERGDTGESQYTVFNNPQEGGIQTGHTHSTCMKTYDTGQGNMGQTTL